MFDDDHSEEEYFELPYEVECVHATEKAIKVTYVDGGKEKELWVPIKVIHDDSDVFEVGHEGLLRVKTKFAEEEGWEDL